MGSLDLSRTGMTKQLVAALIVTLTVSAVWATAASGANDGPGTLQTGSVLRQGFVDEPDSMNPFIAVLSESYYVFAHVYDLLVGIGPDLTPTPQLAKDWSVSPDGLTWTFNLQEGVVWHDDEPANPHPFTSRDVAFTFQYIQQCKLSLFLGYIGDPTDPGPDGVPGNADDPVYISSIDTPTDTQVVIHTNKPKANMLSLYVFIVPERQWTAVGCSQAKHGYANEPPIGTGMYEFITWQKGRYIQMNLNTDYYMLQPGRDYVDEVRYLFYKSDTALYNDYVAGNLDVTFELNAQQFLSLRADIDGASTSPDADPDPDITKFVQETTSISELGFCSADDALVDEYGVSGERHWLVLNVTIRRAIAKALNKDLLVDTVWSEVDQVTGLKQALASPGSSLIPPATPFWHYNVTAQENLTFDLNAAAALLSDPAGNGAPTTDAQPPNRLGSNLDRANPLNRDAFGDYDGDGIREVFDVAYVSAENPETVPQANRAVRGSTIEDLRFGIWIITSNQAGLDSAELVRPDLASIGIVIEVKPVSAGQQLSASYACDYDLYVWGWGFDVDPDFGLSVMTKSQILAWQDAWYYNATYDQWYLDQQQAVNLYARQVIVHNMQKLLYRDQPYNILWYDSLFTVVRSDRFTNWGDWKNHSGLGLPGFGNVFVMLTLQPLVGAANQCPTSVEIGAPIVPPRIVYVGEPAPFVGTASDAELDPLTWTWAWDDGSAVTTVTTASGATSVTVEHTWTAAGHYNITMSVTDNLCGSSVPAAAAVWVWAQVRPSIVGWIEGTVTDSQTTLAIEGVLMLVTPTTGPGSYSDVTGADGTYNVTVPTGTYTVTAQKILYASQVKSAAVSQDTTTTVDFALVSQRGWVFGKVTDASNGAVLEGVAIQAVNATGREYPTTTNATGDYNLTVPPETYRVEVVQAVGFIVQNRTGIVVANGAAVRVDFALQPVPRPSVLSPLLVATIGVAVVAVIGAVAYMVLRRRKREKAPEVPPPTGPGGTPPQPPQPPP